MKVALLKFILIMTLALVLLSIIAFTSPNHLEPHNSSHLKQVEKTELGVLNHAIAEIKQKAQADFAAAASQISIAKSSTTHLLMKNGTFFGIDVSHYQGNLLSELSNSKRLSFIIAKATNGDSEVDPMFQKNWQLIKQSSRIRGTYHFYLANDDPHKQAKHFVSTVGQWGNHDISPIVDVETASLANDTQVNKLHQDLLSFLHYVEKHTNRLPIIYSNYAFAQQWLNNTKFSRYPLWIADYTKASTPNIPDIWKQKGPFIWQRSDNYHLDSEEEDFDIFHGELTNLTGKSH